MRKIAIFVDTFEPVTLRKLDIITQIHNSNMFDIIYIIVDDDDNIEAKELLLKCVIKYAIDTKWFNKGLTLGFINCVHTSIVKYIQCIQKEYDITIIIDDNLNGYY